MKRFTLMWIKHVFVMFVLVAFSAFSYAQMPDAISIEPESGTGFETITLTLTPSLACHQDNEGSLEGASVVKMHSSAVLLGEHHAPPYDWKHVVDYNSTGANGQAPTLEKVSDDSYTFTFNPSEFYGIEEGNTIVGIYAVFNDGQWDSKAARDFGTDDCVDFFIPLKYEDPKPVLKFNVNMNKLISEELMDPVTDQVFVEVDGFEDLELLDTEINGIYEGIIDEGVTENTTYSIKIYYTKGSDKIYEDESRSITAQLGINLIDVWFNDEILMKGTINLDMNYQIGLGIFDPASDFVDLAGTFTSWDEVNGYNLVDNDGDGIYTIEVVDFTVGTTYEYKFRINGLWETSEFPGGGPNRKYTPTEDVFTLDHIYDDFRPDRAKVTFNVNMSYQIAAGHFDPAVDFLDVAGTFNNWETGDILMAGDNDIYSITIPFFVPEDIAQFKFRFNGNWDTSELGGQPNRSLTIPADAGGTVVEFDCWYNDDDPAVPSKPRANNVKIFGLEKVGNELQGMYTYEDVNGDEEGETLIQWYRADDDQGTNIIAIEGATTLMYTLVQDDFEKYIAVEITPVALTGEGETLIGDISGAMLGPVLSENAITFNLNMNYQIDRGNFDPLKDFVDIAGTLTSWDENNGFNMMDKDGDGIYSMLFDELEVGTVYEYKYRINGVWATSEFPGGEPNRTYTAVAGDVVTVWYNNDDPTTPVAPRVNSVSIEGTQEIGLELTGVYDYEDVNGDEEGESIYQWYRADDVDMTNKTEIAGANSINYTLTDDDYQKYVVFEVTPVSATGEPSIGESKSAVSGQIFYTGIGDQPAKQIVVYPNPVNEMLYIKNADNIIQASIFNIVGQNIITTNNVNSSEFSINTSGLQAGVYFISFYSEEGRIITSKFIKR